MLRWLKAAVVGLLISVIGTGLVLTPMGVALEERIGLTWLFEMRGDVRPPSDAVVIAIDQRTGHHLGLPRLPRDWPRSMHAEIVDRLVALGVSAIVFDLDFRDPREEHDRVLAAAIRRADRVVLVQALESVKQPLGDIARWTESVQTTPSSTRAPSDTDREQAGGSLWVERVISPAEVLADAAYAMGAFPLPKTKEAVYQYWAFKPSLGDAPTVPAVALQVHAMSAYEDWRRLLMEAGAQGIANLPATPRDIRGTSSLRSVMVQIRRSFQADPDLTNRLKPLLERLDAGDEETKLIRALHGLYSGADHRYLNFYGTPGTIKTIPYHRVAGDDWESLNLRNKVAFIGLSDVYNPGQQDWFPSAVTSDEGVDLSGVEIAATAFGNLANRKALTEPDTGTMISIVSVFGAVLGAGIYLLPSIVAVPIALVLAALYGFGAQHAFNTMNLWLPLSTPLLVQLPMAIFIGLLCNYLSERKRKRQITRAIGYFLPEHVADEFGRGSLAPSSLDRVVYATCLATDMAGFTTITEAMPPEKSALFINQYFEALAAPLKKHGVSVTEFRADGIMCAWTALQPGEEVRRSAILAALETRDAIMQFAARTSTPLTARIGLDADLVYIGHAGGGGHFVYSIVGDAANTASRMEGLNKILKTRLLATEKVTSGIRALRLRPLGLFQLRGKKEAVNVVEILARESEATGIQRQLCAGFADALEAVRERRWREAAGLFEAMLERFPEDGPSQFYLDYCTRFMNDGSSSGGPPVIHLDVDS